MSILPHLDSLLLYQQLDEAQSQIDSILPIVENNVHNKSDNNLLLNLKYRRLLIMDVQEYSPATILQGLIELLKETNNAGLIALSYKVHLLIALQQEKAENLDLCLRYLNHAHQLFEDYHLDSLFSTYCIRRSSYLRFVNERDSSLLYAKQAMAYAEKYNNQNDLRDAYLLIGSYYAKKQDIDNAIKYNLMLIEKLKSKGNIPFLAIGYINLSMNYLKQNNFEMAKASADSACKHFDKLPKNYQSLIFRNKYKIWEAEGKFDSAFFYLNKYHTLEIENLLEDDKIKAKRIEEEYRIDLKETSLKLKNQQLLFIICVATIILLALILILLKNRKINTQNKTIQSQILTLEKVLEQKQTLLSELQHRVKNNLQYVISFLEMQKESANFNNLEEIIRENQNRIHSMALLHKKLSVQEDFNIINLKNYLTELTSVVKESYDNQKQKIALNVHCEIDAFPLDKALPIGLIVTELISNSMKHAFHKVSIGVITIEISETKDGFLLYYSDNGPGFDFYQTQHKGLGMEIINGLIKQLKGTVHVNNSNAFELNIQFK